MLKTDPVHEYHRPKSKYRRPIPDLKQLQCKVNQSNKLKKTLNGTAMLTYLIPDPQSGKAMEAASHAEMNLCWTCHSCNTECPVNIATNRLHPLKIVHKVSETIK